MGCTGSSTGSSTVDDPVQAISSVGVEDVAVCHVAAQDRCVDGAALKAPSTATHSIDSRGAETMTTSHAGIPARSGALELAPEALQAGKPMRVTPMTFQVQAEWSEFQNPSYILAPKDAQQSIQQQRQAVPAPMRNKSAAATAPANDAHAGTSDAPAAASSQVSAAASSVQPSITGTPVPVSDAPAPVSSAPAMESGTPAPMNGALAPAMDAPSPVSDALAPISDVPAKANNVPAPGSDMPASKAMPVADAGLLSVAAVTCCTTTAGDIAGSTTVSLTTTRALAGPSDVDVNVAASDVTTPGAAALDMAPSKAPAPAAVTLMEHEGNCDLEQTEPIMLFGPVDIGFGTFQLEKHPDLKLARLQLIARKERITDAGAEAALALFRQVLERGEPMTVMYDVRNLSVPSSNQLRMGIDWVKRNSHLLDEYLQGIVVILTSWVVQTVANFLLNIFRPPQPVRVCKNEHEALQFCLDKCQVARSWGDRKAEKHASSSSENAGLSDEVSMMRAGLPEDSKLA
mmetsp:Transcript_36926/g.61195  ORF Transcript_36926/g.61195 Transcript_36926/m.61195 type:complete len:516 (-) Transcript_36926:269-1816(-)|eukprot:CAMPEP_0119317114 /NCGR_PEP_ID=MMETSP1333-20130426/42020_1 /TAXON_ID=418940 /ORGANISM="Scyphosphaera apsteinii, Strain RCC1455" /LENGTH=515 /DNA_ID=CAMNT_0007322955 /DNA_START=49 /DNA_END=1596 /DNA_ORIENTATION=+